MVEDLKKCSKHVNCIDFENGVVKLQNDEEAKLTAGEKEALELILLPTITETIRDPRKSFSLSK
jgi:hypothetical protein